MDYIIQWNLCKLATFGPAGSCIRRELKGGLSRQVPLYMQLLVTVFNVMVSTTILCVVIVSKMVMWYTQTVYDKFRLCCCILPIVIVSWKQSFIWPFPSTVQLGKQHCNTEYCLLLLCWKCCSWIENTLCLYNDVCPCMGLCWNVTGISFAILTCLLYMCCIN